MAHRAGAPLERDGSGDPTAAPQGGTDTAPATEDAAGPHDPAGATTSAGTLVHGALVVLHAALEEEVRRHGLAPGLLRGLGVTYLRATSARRITVTLAIETAPGAAGELVEAIADALAAPVHTRGNGGHR